MCHFGGVIPAKGPLKWAFFCLLLSLVLPLSVLGIEFEVTTYSRCVGEDIEAGVLVAGNYKIVDPSEDGSDKVSVKVSSPKGMQLHFHENAQTGTFGFTTTESGQFMACFWIPPHTKANPQPVTVDLDWKTGVAATDWAAVAKKDKLDGLTLELMKLEGVVEAIRSEMNNFRDKEMKMRNTDEITNSRVAYLSVLSLFVCLALAASQLWYLKTYFEQKKLL